MILFNLSNKLGNPSFYLGKHFDEKRQKCFIWCYNGITWQCRACCYFLLGKLSTIIEKRKISLYRDDELKRKEKEKGREKDVMLFSIMRD